MPDDMIYAISIYILLSIFLRIGKDYSSFVILLNPFIFFEAIQQMIASDIYNNKNSSYSQNLYSLPFKEYWFVANGGEDIENSHSWDIIAQRYAYDFVIVKNEITHDGLDIKNNKSYYCFGQPIFSAQAGKVVRVINWIWDSKPSEKESILIPSIAGNLVVIKHDNNEYSTYAHLKKGSIVLKKGQQIKEGELIGLCGSSGNSSEPHLHFQIQKGKFFHLSAPLIIRFKNVDIKTGNEEYSFDEITIQKDTYVRNIS